MGKPALDLTNQRFKKLIATKPSHQKGVKGWECLCDCGNKKFFATFSLTNNKAKDCGCVRESRFSLLGKVFKMLTVIKRVENSNSGKPRYLCKCECGVEKIAESRHLNNGATWHCGCQNILKVQTGRCGEYGESLRNRVLYTYKSNAARRGYEFSISDEKAFELFEGNCVFCNEPPSNVSTHKAHYGTFVYNGIDRINSLKGYTDDNVQPCCKVCNIGKNEMTDKEWIDHCKKVATRYS